MDVLRGGAVVVFVVVVAVTPAATARDREFSPATATTHGLVSSLISAGYASR